LQKGRDRRLCYKRNRRRRIGLSLGELVLGFPMEGRIAYQDDKASKLDGLAANCVHSSYGHLCSISNCRSNGKGVQKASFDQGK
jgi:hypothetical protein